MSLKKIKLYKCIKDAYLDKDCELVSEFTDFLYIKKDTIIISYGGNLGDGGDRGYKTLDGKSGFIFGKDEIKEYFIEIKSKTSKLLWSLNE